MRINFCISLVISYEKAINKLGENKCLNCIGSSNPYTHNISFICILYLFVLVVLCRFFRIFYLQGYVCL